MMSEFFVKLVIANIKRAYEEANLPQIYFFEILVTIAIEKIREHIVKEAELEGRRKVLVDATVPLVEVPID
jgi:Na+/H+-dicarboxylate symporter